MTPPAGADRLEHDRGTMKARTESRRVVDVEIPGGSTFRMSHVEDAPGGPMLVLAHGFGGGEEPFRRPDYCGPPIRLPASVLPQLQQALEALEGL